MKRAVQAVHLGDNAGTGAPPYVTSPNFILALPAPRRSTPPSLRGKHFGQGEHSALVCFETAFDAGDINSYVFVADRTASHVTCRRPAVSTRRQGNTPLRAQADSKSGCAELKIPHSDRAGSI